MEPYKIASALRGVVAQRLMRRLCPALPPRRDRAGARARARGSSLPGTTLYEAVGCPECSQTGYRGRFSIMEVLTVNGEIERRIGQGATAEQIAEAARRSRDALAVGERAASRPRGRVDPGGAAAGHRRADGAGQRARRAAGPARRSGRPRPHRRAGRHPRRRAAVPSLDFTMDMELVEEPGAPEAGSLRRGRGTKVLLVEDEEQLRRVMKDLLEREGYLVSEARDGIQALDEVDRHAPDIIVLDLNLPGLDGYSVLQQLRSRPVTRGIPVMVLTAKGDEDNEVRVFELGADDFMTKPFRARALAARLEAVLGRRRA